jgi:MFS family permease
MASGIIIFALFVMVFFFMPRARHVLIQRPSRRPTRDVARDLLKNIPLLACWLATLGGCLGLGCSLHLAPDAQDQEYTSGKSASSLPLGGAYALSRFPFGRLSDRVGRRSNCRCRSHHFALSVGGLGMAITHHFHGLCAGVGMSMGLAFTALGHSSRGGEPGCGGLAMGATLRYLYWHDAESLVMERFDPEI